MATYQDTDVKNIMERYEVQDDVKTGEQAYESMAKLSNVDPSESTFNQGDVIEFPNEETLKKCCILRPFRTRMLGALAVQTTNGESKLLYVSTLRKRIRPYKVENGQVVPDMKAEPLVSSTKLYKDVLSCATLAHVVKLLAGKAIEVSKVLETDSAPRYEDVNGTSKITGLQNGRVPCFEYYTKKK